MNTTDFRAPDTDADAPMYCANHPTVETYLRCGKCDKPICAKCRVSTPVGFRCYECANVQVLPTYAISSGFYVKAIVAGVLVAIGTGVLMGLFPAFEFWAALLMGITVPEAVTGAANRKRGPGLQWIAMACVVLGFVVSRIVLQAFPFAIPLGGINMPSQASLPFLRDLPFYISEFSILWLVMALFLANRRLR